MLRNLSNEALERFAEHLQMRRYEDGARVLDSSSGGARPLRLLAHGHASWEPHGSKEKRGAWMLMPGSVFGLEAVNEWARRKQLPGAWPITEHPEIRCRAVGPIWALELPPERFDQAFGAEGGPLAARLLQGYPSAHHGPAIVAALREIPQFSRVSSVSLYRMLEYTRTVTFHPPGESKLEQQVQLDVQQLPVSKLEESPDSGKRQRRLVDPGRALYFVLDGVLHIETDGETVVLGPGSLGGPDLFRHSELRLARPTTTVETHAVIIDGYVLFEMLRSDPGFGRTLGARVSKSEVTNK
ncbi:MAG: hypothetical protein R6X02_00210 [Enhygromyxa sp.]